MYNDVLAELNRVFNGSSMVTIAEDEGIGRLIVTFEKGVEYMDFLITFGEEFLIIEGCANGCVCSTAYVDYDDVDFIGTFNEKFISIYGDVNAEVMREMFN